MLLQPRPLRRHSTAGPAARHQGLKPHPDDPVFCNQFFQLLRPQTAIAALRLVWEERGVDHTGFMLHSARKFGACLLAMAGASAEQLRTAGRWASTSNAMITYCARLQPGGVTTMNPTAPRGALDDTAKLNLHATAAIIAAEPAAVVDMVSSEDAAAIY